MGVGDIYGGLLGNALGGGFAPQHNDAWGYLNVGGWTSITTATADCATSSNIVGWPGGYDDEPEEPAPSTPMAWLDERVADVTSKGRKLLEAA